MATASVHDPLEREAAVAADRIEHGPIRAGSSHQSSTASPRYDVPGSAGFPLSHRARDFFEPLFAEDFSEVRIHADGRAAQAARDVHAVAFTTGRHIVFDQGQYEPDTTEGQRLLAHELAHVVQQRALGRPLLQRQPAPVDEFAPKGPQAQAREDMTNALLIASQKLAQAIANRDNGAPLPMDVFDAYNRFFKGSSLDELDLLRTRVDDALGWAPGMPFDAIPNPVPPGYRDAAVHRIAIANPAFHAVAFQPPLSAGDNYIALYPPWFADAAPKRTELAFHELFHFFPGVRHTLPPAPTEPPWENARAYQGFVGTLAGLPEPAGITAMFPP